VIREFIVEVRATAPIVAVVETPLFDVTGLSSKGRWPKITPATYEEDKEMYFHALFPSEVDSRARAMSAAGSRENAKPPTGKVLVPFDGSPAARCALAFAIERAREQESAIHVVNVQADLNGKEAGERILAAARVQLDFGDVRHTTELAFGFAAQSIVRSAVMERCDLIVMGTRDRLAIAQFFSASVSSQVIRLAQVPVTVVKQKIIATTYSPRRISTGTWRPAW
jgi:nucleotide-binding universal stress UspA family protein